MYLNRIFNSQTKTITGATGILVISSLISGILGILRDRLLASHFGAGIDTSIYFAAFRIPDLVYNLLIFGGILVAFLPIFSEYFAGDKEKAWQMTNYVLNVFFVLLISIAGLLFILTPWLIRFIAPGFSPEIQTRMIPLVRLLFLSPILLGLSNIFSSILQYFHRFLSYSLAPILYNLGIIFGILFLSPYFGIFGVGMGVIIGAFFHLFIQIPSAINCGFKYHFLFSFKYPAIKRIFALMVPRIFGVAAQQFNLIFITSFASTITLGSIAIFNFANNLQGLPISILGVSLATAIFPTFSKLWVNGQKNEFTEKVSLVLRRFLFFTIPLGILIFILDDQLVRLVLGTGRFSLEATRLTAVSLGLFSISIFASTLIPFLARTFFSLQDTKTPTLVTLISVTTNISLSILFVRLLNFPNFFNNSLENLFQLKGIENIAVIGLPLAFSTAAIIQFILLLLSLYKKIGGFNLKPIFDSFKKIILASTLMIIVTILSLNVLSSILNVTTFEGALIQTIISSISGITIYIFIAFLFKSPELKMVKTLIFGRINNQ